MRVLFIDIETTGTTEIDDVWQIAWIIAEGNRIVKIRNRFYPLKRLGTDYWKFSGNCIFKNGLFYPLSYINKIVKFHFKDDEELKRDIDESDIMVSHNVDFEYRFLSRAVNIPQYKLFCTMKVTTELCKIPGRNGYKYPKLEEAVSILIPEPHPYDHFFHHLGYHDAIFDAWQVCKLYAFITRREIDYVLDTPCARLVLEVETEK